MDLHLAAGQGDATEVSRLLAAGADPNAVAEDSVPLHFAAFLGHTRAVRTLLAGGASPEVPDSNGTLPIHSAAGAGHAATVRLLLEAAPHTAAATDEHGRTPLYLVARRGMAALVQLMLAAAPHAAVVKTADAALFPLFVAAQEGHVEVVRLLLEAAPQAALEEAQLPGCALTPLFTACLGGHAAVVRQLLAVAPQAASMRANGTGAVTPLFAAIGRGHVDIVRLILQAAPQAALVRSSKNVLPLHFVAASTGLPWGATMAQLLLAVAPGKATVAGHGQHGTVLPLHVAAFVGNAAIAQVLVHAAPEVAAIPAGIVPRTPLEVALQGAAEATKQHDGVAEESQLSRFAAYLDTARTMLADVPSDLSLPLLVRFVDVALPLFPTVAAHWPLTAAQWQQVPSPCPGLGSALPAALQRSEAEADSLVAHLPAADAARLRAFALALRRSQRQLGIFLPGELVGRILSLFDA